MAGVALGSSVMKSHRSQRIANVVRRVVSDAISRELNDPRIEPLSSVTRVEVSGDLEHAKVFVSVMGDEASGRRTLAGLQSAAGHVQRIVARQIAIRRCPRISFHLDESLKRAAEMIRLIEANRPASADGPAVQPGLDVEAQGGGPCGDQA